MIIRSLLIAAALAVTFPAAAEPRETTVPVAEQDGEMIAAIAEARMTLPRFWTAMETAEPGTGGYSLKVAITDGDQVEHFTTTGVEHVDSKIFARIANTPQFITTVAYDQRIEVPEADISDWMYLRNGKVVGGYTLRLLLSRMTPAEKEAAGVAHLEFEEP
ncbi:hypothetical protein sos41_33370 [Alphaproteobacteria bacterium SO-S41]|nr:hypothetical protein sos41_33370 [Alphaproteobacteria bacterium SO-S41]